MLSAAVTNSTAKPGEEGVYFSSRFIVHHEESQSRKLEAVTEAETMEECYLLTYSACGLYNPGALAWGGTAHSGVNQ